MKFNQKGYFVHVISRVLKNKVLNVLIEREAGSEHDVGHGTKSRNNSATK